MSNRFFVVLVGLACAVSVDAQNLNGTWHEQRYNATLVLNLNGTYAFRGPTGSSTGQAGVQQTAQGHFLCLRDATGKTYWYRIQPFSANALVLVDPQGVTMTYVRRSPAASAVIATKNGLQLSQTAVDAQARLVQFVVGQNIKQQRQQFGTVYARQRPPAAATGYAPQPQGMSDSTYNALRSSMLEGHAASMNALSSISGVPDYSYSVVSEDDY